ncbi:hypothetical protein KKB40_00620 [Patescibacteria group bacterium]|nr:hypothetical protein [Patescibacteria group bacterium]
MKKFIRLLKNIDRKGWVIILVGTITWSLTMVKSGLTYSYGMGFWGPNGHDGIWHIAIAQGLAKGSWQMPIFAGETITNYHIGFDLILAILHKLTFIPIHTLYFQIISPILAILIGIFAYKFIYLWRHSHLQAFWATFFIYFGGSFGWIISLFRNGEIGGESLFWSQQSVSTLINPPFALSLVLIFTGLYCLTKGLSKKSRAGHYLLLATFLFGTLVQVKVYAGLLCLGELFVAGIWQTIRRHGISVMKVFVGSLVLSILLFAPLTIDVRQTIIYKPFWFLEGMMSFSDRVGWQKFGEAMINYKLGNVWAKGFLAYTGAFAIFILGNFGSRIVGLPGFLLKVGNLKKIDYIELFLVSIILAGILIPTFFIQSGNSWNTIQFMYYSLVFSGILAGVVLGKWLEKVNTTALHSVVVLGVLIFTLPTTIGTLWYHYLPSRPPAMISNEELEALEFLSKQPDGVVLTLPFDKNLADVAVNNPPRPLYLYESTAYVSAFSGKSVYLEDEVNLEITGYDWKDRRENLIEFLETLNISQASDFLKENKIRYIYWIKDFERVFEEQDLVKKTFENDEVQILKLW